MMKYTLFTKPNCPYCVKAKELLDSLDLSYFAVELIDLNQAYEECVATGLDNVPSGHKTVPMMNAAIASANNALAYGGSVTPAQAYMQLKGIYLTIQKSFVSESSWQQWPAAEDLADGQVPNSAWF